ncbi:unnamed protein product [Dracunculus medinensis]|uniref:Transmembrane protein n=1 Tax=Dracunculus medinensis TaxID=318479 RepID=A0A0N4U1S0_DRAME|nr:unnamed protein product [Dracunculus medinensis]
MKRFSSQVFPKVQPEGWINCRAEAPFISACAREVFKITVKRKGVVEATCSSSNRAGESNLAASEVVVLVAAAVFAGFHDYLCFRGYSRSFAIISLKKNPIGSNVNVSTGTFNRLHAEVFVRRLAKSPLSVGFSTNLSPAKLYEIQLKTDFVQMKNVKRHLMLSDYGKSCGPKGIFAECFSTFL